MLSYQNENTSHSRPIVSVIIPTLNEGKNLPLVLPYLPLNIVDEVILVDGRSTDNTLEVAKKILPSIKIVYEPIPGKGAAIRRGFMESHGDILMVIDADGSHDPREIPRYIQALLDGADFVKGSRFTTLGGTTDMPRVRKLGNWALTQMVNVLFSQSFSDLCYGYHAFWRYCLNFLDLSEIDGFEIDASIYLQAVRKKLKVVDVPSFEGSRFYGIGKLQTWPDGWRVLRTICKEWVAGIKDPVQDTRVGFHGYSNALSLSHDTGKIYGPTAHPVNLQFEPVLMDGPQQIVNLEDFFQSCLNIFPEYELETRLTDVLIDILEGLGASSGALFVFKGETLVTDNSYQVFGRKVEHITLDHVKDTLRDGIANWVIQNHQPALIQSTSHDPRWLLHSWEENEHVSRSVIAFPLMVNNLLLALIILTRPDDRIFTVEDLNLLKKYQVRI